MITHYFFKISNLLFKKNSSKILTFVICSNGYGHCKRSAKVINEIFKLNPRISINIIVNKNKVDYVKANLISDSSFFNFDSCLMEDEPDWLNKKLNYSLFIRWANKFKNNPILTQSDLIVSDNYVAPLQVDKKTLLMGSFLWLDIIKDSNKETKKISLLEKKILAQNTPEIISLDRMYMDSLSKKTSVYGVPWFTERKVNKKEFYHDKILITSGGTEQLDDIFLDFIKRLTKKNVSKEIFLDNKLFKKLKNKRIKGFSKIKIFKFTEKCFSSIDAIICRPGIGILTDCVSYLIPPIVIYDNKNPEIYHNANKIMSLKLGIAIKVKENQIREHQFQEILSFINSKEKLFSFQKNLLNEKTNGHKEAANKIIKELFL